MHCYAGASERQQRHVQRPIRERARDSDAHGSFNPKHMGQVSPFPRNIRFTSRLSRSAGRAGREAASTGPLQACCARMSDPCACAALPAEEGHFMRCLAYADALTLPTADPNGARMPGTQRAAARRNGCAALIRADRLPSPNAAESTAHTTGWPDRDSPARLIRRPCLPPCAAGGR